MAEIYAAVTTGEGQLPPPGRDQAPAPRADHRPATRSRSFATRPTCCRRCITRTSSRCTTSAAGRTSYFLAEEYVRRPRSRPPRRSALPRDAPSAAGRGGRLRRARDPQGARLRARDCERPGRPARDRPPRRLAGEHRGVPARRGEAARLRRRQGGRGARHEDRGRRGQGQRDLHGARAGARAGRRRARRPRFRWRWCCTLRCTGCPLYAADSPTALLMQAGAGPSSEDRTAIQELPRRSPRWSARDGAAHRRSLRQRARDGGGAGARGAGRRGGDGGRLVAELFGPS